jgi:hypothetical protein
MPTLDVFNDDAFGVVSLTAAINQDPEGQVVPDLVDDLFEEEGVTTTAVFIDKVGETLSLVPSRERGATGRPVNADKMDSIPFQTVHLPQTAGIMADEVQGVRAFGTESDVQMVEALVTKRQMKMRRQLDATIAFHRIGAIKGQVLDADGTSVLLDVFTEFGLTQQTLSMELDVETTDVRILSLAAKRLSEKSLGGARVMRYRAFCGEGFFDLLISHDDVKAAYERWQDGAALRNDPRAGFEFAGINWVEYFGSVGGVDFIGTNDAYLVPVGVPELLITRFAPANYMETVNTVGLPYYSKLEPMPFNKGMELESQSNPLNLCTRPRAIIKLTHT